MGSGQSKLPEAPNFVPPPGTGIDAKTPPSGSAKPKPCCVCLDEKAERDKCMLFSNADDAQKDCVDLVVKYKKCMEGYGFKV